MQFDEIFLFAYTCIYFLTQYRYMEVTMTTHVYAYPLHEYVSSVFVLFCNEPLF